MSGNGQSPTLTLVFPTDVQSSVTKEECERLAEVASDLDVLELGAWMGRTTIVLSQVAASLHSVDWHRGDLHAGEGRTLIPYLGNLARYGQLERTRVHVARFDEIVPLFRPRSFDVVFLDGFHTYEQVRADIELALPVLRDGGTFVFHDYGVDVFGVTQAVDEFLEVTDVAGTLAVCANVTRDRTG